MPMDFDGENAVVATLDAFQRTIPVRLVPASLAILCPLIVGCGLSDYAEKMKSQRELVNYAVREENNLGGTISTTELTADGKQVRYLQLRLPKGISTVSDKEKLKGETKVDGKTLAVEILERFSGPEKVDRTANVYVAAIDKKMEGATFRALVNNALGFADKDQRGEAEPVTVPRPFGEPLHFELRKFRNDKTDRTFLIYYAKPQTVLAIVHEVAGDGSSSQTEREMSLASLQLVAD